VAGGISVTASGDNSYANMGVYNASGTISSLTVAANGEGSNAEVYISGDVTMGDVTLTASDYFASADVGLNGVAFDNSVINVTSSSYDTSANMNLSNVSGNINSLSIVAGIQTGSEVQGFNYFGYFEGSGTYPFVEGTVLTLTIDGIELSYTITAADEESGYIDAFPCRCRS